MVAIPVIKAGAWVVNRVTKPLMTKMVRATQHHPGPRRMLAALGGMYLRAEWTVNRFVQSNETSTTTTTTASPPAAAAGPNTPEMVDATTAAAAGTTPQSEQPPAAATTTTATTSSAGTTSPSSSSSFWMETPRRPAIYSQAQIIARKVVKSPFSTYVPPSEDERVAAGVELVVEISALTVFMLIFYFEWRSNSEAAKAKEEAAQRRLAAMERRLQECEMMWKITEKNGWLGLTTEELWERVAHEEHKAAAREAKSGSAAAAAAVPPLVPSSSGAPEKHEPTTSSGTGSKIISGVRRAVLSVAAVAVAIVVGGTV